MRSKQPVQYNIYVSGRVCAVAECSGCVLPRLQSKDPGGYRKIILAFANKCPAPGRGKKLPQIDTAALLIEYRESKRDRIGKKYVPMTYGENKHHFTTTLHPPYRLSDSEVAVRWAEELGDPEVHCKEMAQNSRTRRMELVDCIKVLAGAFRMQKATEGKEDCKDEHEGTCAVTWQP
jgi:hypothetical protein